MATTRVKNTQIEFVNSGGSSGIVKFNTDNTLEADRAFKFSSGLVSTGITIGDSGGFTASTNFTSISVNDVSLTAPSSGVTAYTLTLPSVQGAADTVLVNNGSGDLSWSTPPYQPKCIRLSRSSATGSHSAGDFINFNSTDVSGGLSVSSNRVVLAANTRYHVHASIRHGDGSETYGEFHISDGTNNYARLVTESMNSVTGYSAIHSQSTIIDVGSSSISVGVKYSAGTNSAVDTGSSFMVIELSNTGGLS